MVHPKRNSTTMAWSIVPSIVFYLQNLRHSISPKNLAAIKIASSSMGTNSFAK